MVSVSLSLFTPTTSIITTNPNLKTLFNFNPTTLQRTSNNSVTCRASSTDSCSSITGLDLYDLLGIDSSSDQSQIKLAYRGLQKRCHPDIAGPAGHDMAIILNEAYALLSDPNSRFAYDKEQAKMAELRGYTGKPLYSVWFGGESEERAVFVDEVKCVGCLKCALFADKTFAVESVYGRARVVAQWADPEDKIQEAIETCPVDCISIVERSNLAALEFLMSKQPRGNVRIGAGNTAGVRVSNIFVDVEKFQARFQDSMDKSSKQQHSYEGSDLQREARMSAIQAIRSISNWLYWQSPIAGGSTRQTSQKLKRIPQNSSEPNVKKLRAAAAARKQAQENPKPIHQIPSKYVNNDEYWTPSRLVLPNTTQSKSGSRTTLESSPKKELNQTNNNDFVTKNARQSNPLVWGVPMGMATIAAIIVRSQVGEGVASGGLKEHMGGSLALDIVNSSWLQFILAAVPWYVIGLVVVGLIQGIRSKLNMYEE